MRPQYERLSHSMAEVVAMLCRNGVQFNKQLKIEGIIGITLDHDEVFLVNINETLTGNNKSKPTDPQSTSFEALIKPEVSTEYFDSVEMSSPIIKTESPDNIDSMSNNWEGGSNCISLTQDPIIIKTVTSVNDTDIPLLNSLTDHKIMDESYHDQMSSNLAQPLEPTCSDIAYPSLLTDVDYETRGIQVGNMQSYSLCYNTIACKITLTLCTVRLLIKYMFLCVS